MRNTTRAIAFIKAGEKPRAGLKKTATSQDWQLSVDLERPLRFSFWSPRTSLSWSWMCCGKRKRTKYDHLVSKCLEQGCKVRWLLIEVGCRGLVEHSHHRALGVLGITGGARVIKNNTEAAEKVEMTLIRREGPGGQADATWSTAVRSPGWDLMVKDRWWCAQVHCHSLEMMGGLAFIWFIHLLVLFGESFDGSPLSLYFKYSTGYSHSSLKTSMELINWQ